MGRPGRPQSPLDPDDGAIADFAARLRAVHEAMPGTVTLTELSKQASYSTAVFSTACGGKTLPTWDVTAAFLKACRREPDEEWWNAWLAARDEAERSTRKVPRLPTQPPFPLAATAEPTTLAESREDRGPVWRRVVAFAGTWKALTLLFVLVIAVVVTAKFSGTDESDQAGPACEDIGVVHESVDASRVNRAAWQRAYEEAGGQEELGCPLSEPEQGLVHEWGPGLSQDLVDDQKRPTRLMALDADKVFVMTGNLWADYTRPHNNVAAGLLGYPVSEPIRCGPATVVLLDKGELAPGAMVSTPTGRYVWLPRPVWLRYGALGGPAGPLGRPRNELNSDVEGTVEFENGTTIELRSGAPTVRNEPTVASTSTTRCP